MHAACQGSLAEYFALENCIGGMQSLCGKLFGLQFEDVTDAAQPECWDGKVPNSSPLSADF